MIRVIGIQRSEDAGQEFVLLQNQGSMRTNVRGQVLLSESAMQSGDFAQGGYIFRDDAPIPPGMYVLLRTGYGEARWGKTKEGQMVYHAFMNRPDSMWRPEFGPIHILHKHHTFAERTSPALTLR